MKTFLIPVFAVALLAASCGKKQTAEDAKEKNISACVKTAIQNGSDSLKAMQMCPEIFEYLTRKDSTVFEMNTEEFQRFVQDNMPELNAIMQKYQ